LLSLSLRLASVAMAGGGCNLLGLTPRRNKNGQRAPPVVKFKLSASG